MEAQNEYYTPNWDDIAIKGYEMEINTWNGWKRGTFPEILKENKELDEYGNDDIMKLAHAHIRVPYLTKEQIFAEGWEEVGNNQFSYPINALSCYMMIIAGESHQIEIMQDIMDFNARIYRGGCRCINDLRWLMKRLGIKKL